MATPALQLYGCSSGFPLCRGQLYIEFKRSVATALLVLLVPTLVLCMYENFAPNCSIALAFPWRAVPFAGAENCNDVLLGLVVHEDPRKRHPLRHPAACPGTNTAAPCFTISDAAAIYQTRRRILDR